MGVGQVYSALILKAPSGRLVSAARSLGNAIVAHKTLHSKHGYLVRLIGLSIAGPFRVRGYLLVSLLCGILYSITKGSALVLDDRL